MAKSLQRLYVEKESLRLHLEGFLDVRASFLLGILHKVCKEEISAADNNGILGSIIENPVTIVQYSCNIHRSLQVSGREGM